MELIIVGHGKMAAAIEHECIRKQFIYRRWIPGMELIQGGSETVFIHVGSGSELVDAIRFCGKHRVTLLQASSGMEGRIPNNVDCTLVSVINLAAGTVSFVRTLKGVARELSAVGLKPTEILESHPQSKDTPPATALWIADKLGFPPEKIVSVRDPLRQKLELDVPEGYLEAHSYHRVAFGEGEEKAEYSNMILGRKAYGVGAINLALVASIIWSSLPIGIIPMERIIDHARIESA